VHEDQVAYIYEHQPQFRGVRIRQTYLRHYNSQALLAQSLGYTGRISEGELKRLPKDLKTGYSPNDLAGQAGVESSYDGYLHGKDGRGELHIDALGRPLSALQVTNDGQPGLALRLT